MSKVCARPSYKIRSLQDTFMQGLAQRRLTAALLPPTAVGRGMRDDSTPAPERGAGLVGGLGCVTMSVNDTPGLHFRLRAGTREDMLYRMYLDMR